MWRSFVMPRTGIRSLCQKLLSRRIDLPSPLLSYIPPPCCSCISQEKALDSPSSPMDLPERFTEVRVEGWIGRARAPAAVIGVHIGA